MNIYQKILINHVSPKAIAAKNCILPIDWLMVHDGSIVTVEKKYAENHFDRVFDKDRIFVIFDHVYPANTEQIAQLHNQARKFVKRFKIKHFFEGGEGISHQILLEQPQLRAGDILMGGDSHTPTLGAHSVFAFGAGASDMTYAMLTGETWFNMGPVVRVQLTGQPNDNVSAKDVVLTIADQVDADILHNAYLAYDSDIDLPLDWRAVLCNMSPELGAVTAIFEPKASYYHQDPERYGVNWQNLCSDTDHMFDKTAVIDLSTIQPTIAKPHNVNHIAVFNDTQCPVDVVFIGSCTGGRYEDLLTAADILSSSQATLKTRLIVCPASKQVYQKALEQGIITVFIDKGGVILPPSCGPCLGLSMGALGPNEVCVSTSSRNFKGRMGSSKADIYLCSPATAAHVALRGTI